MKSSLLHPQEIEVYYLIPTIRRYLALAMKDQDMSQKDIAVKLHIQDSTVSQYIHDKRGKHITFPDDIVPEIRTSAGHIESKMDLIRETQRILLLLRHSKVLCQVHRQFSDVPESCKIEDLKCG